MWEVVDAPFVDDCRSWVAHCLEVIKNHLLALFVWDFFAVLMLSEDKVITPTEAETKLVQSAAEFLGKQMEE